MVLTIGISGASGIVGTVLRRGLKARGYNVIAITQSPMTIVPALTNSTTEIDSVDEVRVVDWTKQPESVRGVLTGCNAFVHLAASAFVTTSWSDAMTINMTGDFLFMQEAARAGVKRFLYASTNHTLNGLCMREISESLDSTQFGAHLLDSSRQSFLSTNSGGISTPPLISLGTAPDPDSFYAVSKVTGEVLGKFFARMHGLEFVSVRIGWITKEEDPRQSPFLQKDDLKEYNRAMYCGHKDFVNIIDRCATLQQIPEHKRVGKGFHFSVFAVSNNDRRVFDLAETAALIGFHPQQNVEDYVKHDWAHIPNGNSINTSLKIAAKL